MVARKKRNESSPNCSLELGIRKKTKSPTKKQEELGSNSILPKSPLSKNKPETYFDNYRDPKNSENIQSNSEKKNCSEQNIKDQPLSANYDKSPAISQTSSTNLTLSEQNKPQSLSLLSCDYASSTNSSDND